MPEQKLASQPTDSQLPLVVDVSSSPLQVGIPTSDGWAKLESSSNQAMEGLFQATLKLFHNRTGQLKAINTIYYCCGPGSTLGLRLAAAFVKTLLWEAKGRIRLFQYNALDLATCMANEPINSIQAPFRMGKRFVRTGKTHTIGEKHILLEKEALKKYPLSIHLSGPRAIAIEISPEKILNYDLEIIKGLEDLNRVSEPAKFPVPYSPEAVTFKKWEGVIPAKQ